MRLINEMAYSQSLAIDKCNELGKQFIEYFHKIYTNPDSIDVKHWQGEMQGWLNKVLAIKLKTNNRPLLKVQIRDWFLTAGAYFEDWITPTPFREEIEFYDEFCETLLATKDVSKSFEVTYNEIT